MAVEMLSYAALAERLNRANDGKTHGLDAEQVWAKVELAKMELTAACHRADSERERERLMSELLKATADLISAG